MTKEIEPVNMKQVRRSFTQTKTRLVTLSALFACVLSVSSVISVPTPWGVPVTLQVFVVFLIAMILGPKVGTLACAIYVFFGLIGLPVYAGLSYGLPVLIGPTGGYLFGFVAGTFLGGFACRKRAASKRSDMIRLVLAALLSLFVIYVFGVLWLSLYLDSSLRYAILVGALPFLPIDSVKVILAIPIALETRWSRIEIPIL